MKLSHIMLDLETLGTTPYSVILSIGAVHFDPETPGVFRDSFEVAVDPISSVKAGLRIDPNTNMWWWDDQRNEARSHWMGLLKFELDLALNGFNQWARSFTHDRTTGDQIAELRVWGNGANFDNVLLADAYKVTGIEPPWKFHQDRCFRTIKNLGETRHLKPKEGSVMTEGTPHTALYDAFYQAAWMQNIVEALKITVT